MCIISETIINYSIEINMCRVTPFFLYFTLVFTAATQGMIRRMHGKEEMKRVVNISADGCSANDDRCRPREVLYSAYT